MQWTSLLLVTALCGVNCGNRLMSTGYGNSFPPNRNAYSGSQDTNKSLKELITNEYEKLHQYLNTQNKLGEKSLTNWNRNERNRYEDDIYVEAFKQLLADSEKPKASPPVSLGVTDSNGENEVNSSLDAESMEVEAAPPPPLPKSFSTPDSQADINTEDSTKLQLANLPDITQRELYKDLMADLNKMEEKRGLATTNGCDCKVKNDLLDLGQQHFPRYLLNAVCQSERTPNEYPQKCWPGAICRPLEYKVKVLTFRSMLDRGEKDPALAWLPDGLRQVWKFETVTVAAGCFCSY